MARQTQSRRSRAPPGAGGGRSGTPRAPRRGRRRITIRASRAGVRGWASAAHAAGVKTRGTSTAALCVVLDPPTRPSRARHCLSHLTLRCWRPARLPTDRRLEVAACARGKEPCRAGNLVVPRDSTPRLADGSCRKWFFLPWLRGLDCGGRRCVATLQKADRISWLSFGGANGTHDVMVRQQLMA
jgi:hypothetical protein